MKLSFETFPKYLILFLLLDMFSSVSFFIIYHCYGMRILGKLMTLFFENQSYSFLNMTCAMKNLNKKMVPIQQILNDYAFSVYREEWSRDKLWHNNFGYKKLQIQNLILFRILIECLCSKLMEIGDMDLSFWSNFLLSSTNVRANFFLVSDRTHIL